MSRCGKATPKQLDGATVARKHGIAKGSALAKHFAKTLTLNAPSVWLDATNPVTTRAPVDAVAAANALWFPERQASAL